MSRTSQNMTDDHRSNSPFWARRKIRFAAILGIKPQIALQIATNRCNRRSGISCLPDLADFGSLRQISRATHRHLFDRYAGIDDHACRSARHQHLPLGHTCSLRRTRSQQRPAHPYATADRDSLIARPPVPTPTRGGTCCPELVSSVLSATEPNRPDRRHRATLASAC